MHNAQNPGPTHRQRQEGQKGQLQAPKREAEEEEHHDAADIKDVVEVGRKRVDQIVAHVADAEGKTRIWKGFAQLLFDRIGRSHRHPNKIDYTRQRVMLQHIVAT